jgi:hypothetical protein
MLAPLAAVAAPITDLYNTGVDNAGALLGSSVDDPHYAIILSPTGTISEMTTPLDYPFPLWAANDSNSRWIGVAAYQAIGPAGFYRYRTTFTLPTVSITGRWGTDDQSNSNIWINGVATGQTSAGFSSLVSFVINSGFTIGTNTLDFDLVNTGGPTGLRVDDMVGSYQTSAVPDCLSTWAAVCTAFCGLLVGRSRRRE